MTPLKIDSIYLTTASQQGFLLGSLAYPDRSIFIEQLSIKIIGNLDIEVFREVWKKLILRHEILRTGFVWNLGDAPRQVVMNTAELPLFFVDVCGRSKTEQKRVVTEHQSSDVGKNFNLKKPPLIRLTLIRSAYNQHQLILTSHHSILDGWSQFELLSQLVKGYTLLVHHQEWIEPSTETSFGDYATQLHKMDISTAKTFWQSRLNDYKPVQLEVNSSFSKKKELHGLSQRTIKNKLRKRLLKLTQDLGVTSSALFIGIWCLVVSYRQNRKDISIGLTVSGRAAEIKGVTSMIGAFINTVPLRVSIDETLSFGNYLRQIQDEVLAISEFGYVSTGQIHDWIDIATDQPLYDSVIALSTYPRGNFGAENSKDAIVLLEESICGRGGLTLLPLSLVVADFGSLNFRLVNRRDYINDDIAEQVLHSFYAILDRIGDVGHEENLDFFLSTINNIQICVKPSLPRSLLQCNSEPKSRNSSGSINQVVGFTVASILGKENISNESNFLVLGGHSIVAIKLLEKLRDTFDVELTLRDLFESRDISTIAEKISELINVRTDKSNETLPEIASNAMADSDMPFPLTDLQQAYWAGRQCDFELSSVDSHIYCEVNLHDVDLSSIEKNWNLLIQRHPMLRAVFTRDGQQKVLSDVPFYNILTTKLQAVSESEESRRLEQMRTRMSHIRRAPEKWPLFTIEAALLPNKLIRLFLSFDLLIGDALSWSILYHEMSLLYSSPDTLLPKLNITFRDYVLSLPSLKKTERFSISKNYWKKRVTELPLAPQLPVISPKDIEDQVRFVRQQVVFSPKKLATLRQRAISLGVTLSGLLLSVFADTIAQFSNNSNFILNLTLFNRPPLHPQIDTIVGDFTSLILLEVNNNQKNTFAERVRQLQRQLWQDMDHRWYSGIEVMRDLAHHHSTPMRAISPVVFTSTLDLNSGNRTQDNLIEYEVVYAIGQTPQVLLDCQTYEYKSNLIINWDSTEELFPEGFLDAMWRTFCTLLEDIIQDSSCLGKKTVLTSEQPIEERKIVDWDIKYLHEPFLKHAAEYPSDTAVISKNCRMSYGELRQYAVQCADSILQKETNKDSLIAIVMEKGWEQIVAVLGTSMSGEAFVPIDPHWPNQRIVYLFETTRIGIVLTQRRILSDRLVPNHINTIVVDELVSDECVSLVDEQSPSINHRNRQDGLAYVIFTSGSTGIPKGVMVSHSAAINTILDINSRFRIGQNDSLLSLSPLPFDLSIYDIFGLLSAGGAIIMPDESERHEPLAWMRWIADEKVTIWNSVPVLMNLLLETVEQKQSKSLQSLRLCLLSGDWIPLSLPSELKELTSKVQAVSLGGATEGGIWSVLYEIDVVDPRWSSIPYGKAMSGQSVCVFDKNLLPCPIWVPGEIYISGNSLASGYWDEPELTSSAFLHHPKTRQRIYRTGDLGRLLPDGNIEFLGRFDSQVKIRGYRVEVREIETVISKIKGVKEVVILATGSRYEQKLIAFWVGTTRETELRREASIRLPSHMMPSSFIALKKMPVSDTGKIDRKALTKMVDTTLQAQHSLMQSDELTNSILQLLQSFVEVESINPHSDLINLGLNSVDIIRLFNAIEAEHGHRLNIQTFFQTPTVSTLVQGINLSNNPKNTDSPKNNEATVIDSPWKNERIITNPEERARFRSAYPKLLGTENKSEQKLLSDPLDNLEKYHHRHSYRTFLESQVPLDQFGKMLTCLRCIETEGRKNTFLYPSAGGLYSVSVLIYVRPKTVEGIASGLYSYHPVHHNIIPSMTNIDLDMSSFVGVTNRSLAQHSAFTIFLVTDPDDSAPLYGKDAEQLALLNAGYLGQLLCNSAVESGLGLCPVHGIDFEHIRWLFPDPKRLVLLHTLMGGLVKITSTRFPITL